MGRTLRIGIVTSSDSCAAGDQADGSGAAGLVVEERGWEVAGYRLCADDRALTAAIVDLADVERADVVFITGGTGFGSERRRPRSRPSVACDRMAPGIAEDIRAESRRSRRARCCPAASRACAATLVINLPGSVKAARESFGFVADQLEHAVEMMAGGGHD